MRCVVKPEGIRNVKCVMDFEQNGGSQCQLNFVCQRAASGGERHDS